MASKAKPTLDALGKRFLIKTYTDASDEYVGYDLYSDGWCEQRGRVPSVKVDSTRPVVFPRPFATTVYYVVLSGTYSAPGGGFAKAGPYILWNSRLATGFTYANDSDTGGDGFWIAQGYATLPGASS